MQITGGWSVNFIVIFFARRSPKNWQIEESAGIFKRFARNPLARGLGRVINSQRRKAGIRQGSRARPSSIWPIVPWILPRTRVRGTPRARLVVDDRNATAITAIIAILSEFQHVNGYCDWSGRFDPDFPEPTTKANCSLAIITRICGFKADPSNLRALLCVIDNGMSAGNVRWMRRGIRNWELSSSGFYLFRIEELSMIV